jgi:hypothetical protein
MPLLRQADNYRAIAARADREKSAREAITRTADALARDLPATLEAVASQLPVETQHTVLQDAPMLASREINLSFKGDSWRVRIELSDDPAEGDWLTLSDVSPNAISERFIEIRVSYVHPFMVRFAPRGGEDLEALLRVAAALALAEALAHNNGVKFAGTVRRNLNEILRSALSAPDRERSR